MQGLRRRSKSLAQEQFFADALAAVALRAWRVQELRSRPGRDSVWSSRNLCGLALHRAMPERKRTLQDLRGSLAISVGGDYSDDLLQSVRTVLSTNQITRTSFTNGDVSVDFEQLLRPWNK